MWSSHVAVQPLSHAGLSRTSWTTACQASLPFTISGVCLNSYPLSHWFYTYIPSLIHLLPLPPYYSSRSPQCNSLSSLGSSTGGKLQQLPTSYLFYKWHCIYCNTTLSIHLTLSFSIFELKWVLCERYPSQVSSSPLIFSSQSLLRCIPVLSISMTIPL